jgi:hypothetical protein
MQHDEIVQAIRESLAAITNPRFYETERGFQGELLVLLHQRAALPDQAIIEQEYQKVARGHGLTCRPDIIMHEPFNPERHRNRAEGNYAVIELKRRASAKRAMKDFISLSDMIRVLRYPLGIFINIGTGKSHADLVPEGLGDRIACFATTLRGGAVHIIEG